MIALPKEYSVTCCCIIPIRKGIITLLSLNIILNFVRLVLAIIEFREVAYAFDTSDPEFYEFDPTDPEIQAELDNDYRMSIVAITFITIKIVLAIWGLRACVQRNLALFQAYTIVYGIMLASSLISIIWYPDIISAILSTFGFYWIYVYIKYVQVLKDQKQQKSQSEETSESSDGHSNEETHLEDIETRV